MNLGEILEYRFWDNEIQVWLIGFAIAAGLLCLFFVVKRFIGRLFRRSADRTEALFPRIIADALAKSGAFFFVLIAIDIGSKYLQLPASVRGVLDQILVIVIILQIARWANHLVGIGLEYYRKAHPSADEQVLRIPVRVVAFVLRVVVWLTALALCLETVGFDVTALVTGLGISGIVIALAAQNIVADLFATLMIVVDRPFVVGDMIGVDTMTGQVERIGLKTTRLRSTDGEQLLIGNQDLLKSRLRNFRQLVERRALFRIGVVYGTDAGKLEKIPVLVRKIVEATPQTRFDRAHFAAFAESALEFEISFYVTSEEMAVYMDARQVINLGICRAFEKAGIEFAFPTRTLQLAEPAALAAAKKARAGKAKPGVRGAAKPGLSRRKTE